MPLAPLQQQPGAESNRQLGRSCFFDPYQIRAVSFVRQSIKARSGFIYRLLDNKYYMDKINDVVFARGAVAIGRGLWKEGDVVVIDGIVNGSARFIGWFAGVIRFLQSGYIYHYAFAMIIGMLGLLTLFVTLGGK